MSKMTLSEANEYFETLPNRFAVTDSLKAAMPEQDNVTYIGIAGTAGKTAVASLLAAILRAAGLRTGLYTAGWGELAGRIRVDDKPVEEADFTAAADFLAQRDGLPKVMAELAAACRCFAAAGCSFAVVELPDAGLAEVLPQMPVCAVTHIGPNGSGRSIERLAHDAANVMRKGTICVTAPDQPKEALQEIIVTAGKYDCELVVPDPEDITFLEAGSKYASRIDYGGYAVPLAFLGRHAAGNAAVAVEMALALWRKGYDIPDESILNGLAAVENRSSIRVLRQRPLEILDACRTPQQAAALVQVLQTAKLKHLNLVLGLRSREGAEELFSTLETGTPPKAQNTDRESMPGMGDGPFDHVYLVTPERVNPDITRELAEKAKFHFDAQLCQSFREAIQAARAAGGRGIVVCGSEAAALEAEKLLGTPRR